MGGGSTAPRNAIIDQRPWSSLAELAAFSGIGPATIQALESMVASWSGPAQDPIGVTLAELAWEAANHGTASPYFDQLVTVQHAIITRDPVSYSSGSTSTYAADPAAGNVEQLRVFIDGAYPESTGFLTLFDDVKLTGRFTQYYATFEILVDETDQNEATLNTSGLYYGDYARCVDAWTSTAANPGGAVRVESSFDYTYMVPLPVFTDHPMYQGQPDPGTPADFGGSDHPGQLWCGEQQGRHDAWLATQ
ncbi:MAG: hypothetical protein JRI23_11525 [Deltaproteobacteria bacterium]|jgi:hypothetical protein|nr:hypothetical protein [Deltaproteobacteria bacterium]MBW2532328.1 hypothetical protein [Deltaproteobacteria bacterium]